MTKIIFSRKGMDSSYGGLPSAFVRGGDMVSLPIPNAGRPDKGIPADKLRYEDLVAEGGTLRQRIEDLSRSKRKPGSVPCLGGTGPVWTCHHDPDLDLLSRKRPVAEGWLPSLGQLGSSQSHLDKQNVEPGDIFLFFGWYREAIRDADGRLRYVRNAPDVHALWGYLEVGAIMRTVGHSDLPAWLADHPHSVPRRRENPSNTIYVARDRLTADPRLPGGGTFRHHDSLILTAPRQSRSRWRIPTEIFKQRAISHHSASSWHGDVLRTAPIGQEFVVERDSRVVGWALERIRDGRVESEPRPPCRSWSQWNWPGCGVV